jgi:hypothetical protein
MLQGRGRRGFAVGAHQPLLCTGAHPQRQLPGIHSPGPTRLVQGQYYYQNGLDRARIPVGERLCQGVQRTLPG